MTEEPDRQARRAGYAGGVKAERRKGQEVAARTLGARRKELGADAAFATAAAAADMAAQHSPPVCERISSPQTSTTSDSSTHPHPPDAGRGLTPRCHPYVWPSRLSDGG